MKIIARIASLHEREKSLEKTINSLLPQVSNINVVLNNYKEIPLFLRRHKINVVRMSNELGDAGKYYKNTDEDAYILTCDDDLVYPSGYADKMICAVKKYNSIVTLHGKIFDNRPIISYYRGATKGYHCLGDVEEDVKVDIGGTGVMCYDNRQFNPSTDDFIHPNMADIFIGKLAFEQGVDIMCLQHSREYLKHTSHIWDIYKDHKVKGDEIQTELINSFLKPI